jgi:hypothetical protein
MSAGQVKERLGKFSPDAELERLLERIVVEHS